jgi:hypothetical protein
MARCARSGASGLREDHGGIVVSWLLKLSVILSLCALPVYDAISITSTTGAVAEQGASAARAAATHWQDNNDVQGAYDAAVVAVAEKNPQGRVNPEDFRIEPDGTVHLSIEGTAKTILVYRVGPISDWSKIHQRASGRPTSL